MAESILGVLLHRTWHGKCTGKRTQTIVQRRKLKHLSVTLSVYATSLLHPLTPLSHPVLHSQAASGSVMPCAPDYDMQFPQNLHTMQPLFPLEDELSYNLTGAFLILIFPFLL